MGIAQRDYMRGDRPRSFASPRDAVPIIIGINILVFVLWQLKPEFFIHYFPLNLARLRQGQIWTVLTSVFSHYNFMHIFFNMFVLYSFGRVLEKVWGIRRFTIFYLLAGITASFVHVMLAMFGWRDSLAVGASGAVAGVVMAFAMLFPRQKIYLFGILPFPAMVLVLILTGMDVVGLIKQYGNMHPGVQIGHGAHLGGTAFGALYVLSLRGSLPVPRLRKRKRVRGTSRPEVGPERTDEEELRLDHLLGKVKEGGLDSLSPPERDFLVRMSRRFREKP